MKKEALSFPRNHSKGSQKVGRDSYLLMIFYPYTVNKECEIFLEKNLVKPRLHFELSLSSLPLSVHLFPEEYPLL